MTDPDDARAAALRQQLLATLTKQAAVSDDVAAAVLAVPRHVFLPGEELETAYADQYVVTKTDEAELSSRRS
jgi:protein-L-isoaspartate(D-aspartate) O-methyltransferase